MEEYKCIFVGLCTVLCIKVKVTIIPYAFGPISQKLQPPTGVFSNDTNIHSALLFIDYYFRSPGFKIHAHYTYSIILVKNMFCYIRRSYPLNPVGVELWHLMHKCLYCQIK